ncbi:MAG: hypothetical protein Q4F49_03885 [Pseudoxanthomonas suwonensis]|nr:hypothetical protein [Pseudoxanthomonas suwonensis]
MHGADAQQATVGQVEADTGDHRAGAGFADQWRTSALLQAGRQQFRGAAAAGSDQQHQRPEPGVGTAPGAWIPAQPAALHAAKQRAIGGDHPQHAGGDAEVAAAVVAQVEDHAAWRISRELAKALAQPVAAGAVEVVEAQPGDAIVQPAGLPSRQWWHLARGDAQRVALARVVHKQQSPRLAGDRWRRVTHAHAVDGEQLPADLHAGGGRRSIAPHMQYQRPAVTVLRAIVHGGVGCRLANVVTHLDEQQAVGGTAAAVSSCLEARTCRRAERVGMAVIHRSQQATERGVQGGLVIRGDGDVAACGGLCAEVGRNGVAAVEGRGRVAYRCIVDLAVEHMALGRARLRLQRWRQHAGAFGGKRGAAGQGQQQRQQQGPHRRMVSGSAGTVNVGVTAGSSRSPPPPTRPAIRLDCVAVAHARLPCR